MRKRLSQAQKDRNKGSLGSVDYPRACSVSQAMK